MIYFESERLIFRSWKDEDLKDFKEMNKDTRVMKYFPKTLSNEETENFYNKIQEEFEREGYGLYAVEIKENGEFIGLLGLHKASFEAEFTPCIEIGWRLKKEAHGKGYATEGAKACIEYGFRELKFQKIYSFTAKINHPSENVMKKIGMKKVMEFNHPNVENDSNLYEHVLYLLESKDYSND